MPTRAVKRKKAAATVDESGEETVTIAEIDNPSSKRTRASAVKNEDTGIPTASSDGNKAEDEANNNKDGTDDDHHKDAATAVDTSKALLKSSDPDDSGEPPEAIMASTTDMETMADAVVDVGAMEDEEDVEGILLSTTSPGTAPARASGPTKPKTTAGINTNFPTHLNPTDPKDFDHFLFQLLACRAESNMANFTIHKEDFPLLHAWMQHLRKEYKTFTTRGDGPSQLTAQQVAVLESLHVPLTSRGDDHWNRFYDLLVTYKSRHGHVLVPRLCEVPGLGDWVTDQRRQYKAKQQGQSTQLSDSRQDKLDALDFVWHVRNRPEWDLRFQELLEYKAVHGDCKVPQHYKPNKALGKWVAKQREQYKLLQKKQHSFLTPYRQEKLNSAGFSWVVRQGGGFDPPGGLKSEGGDDDVGGGDETEPAGAEGVDVGGGVAANLVAVEGESVAAAAVLGGETTTTTAIADAELGTENIHMV